MANVEIDYHGPVHIEGMITDLFDNYIKQFLTREGTIPIFVGKIARAVIQPRLAFILDSVINMELEDAIEAYVKAIGTDREELPYRNALEICIGANSLEEGVSGGYQMDFDSIAFPPRLFVALQYAMGHPQDVPEDWQVTRNKKILDYINARQVPHNIAHEIVHWEFASVIPYTRLRNVFRKFNETIAYDPRLLNGNFYEILNEEIQRKDPIALRYSEIYERIWNNGIRHFNELVTEFASSFIIPPFSGFMYPSFEVPEDITDIVLEKVRRQGPLETIAWAKRLMEQAYDEEKHVYELVREKKKR